MKVIKLLEEQFNRLFENVAITDLKRRKNGKGKAQISYNKGKNIDASDYLKTDKMDANNSDTYIVPLKGGIDSYNITDIHGLNIMHYFKYIFDKKEVDIEYNEETFQLEMKDSEFNSFMQQFVRKVNNIIIWKINEYKKENPKIEFDKVLIYPVPSHSNFNEEMAKRMQFISLGGLQVQKIDSSLLSKDLKNIQKDEDFIKNNQNYYNMNQFPNDNKYGTNYQGVETAVNRLIASKKAIEHINNANLFAQKLLQQYYQLHLRANQEKVLMKMSDLYEKYYNEVLAIANSTVYFSTIDSKTHKPQLRMIANPIKYTKGPSVEKRSGEIWGLIKPYLRGTGLKPIGINQWSSTGFQIKNLPNGVRMGMKGYFTLNNDKFKEYENIFEHSLLVIFDDNVSGGATLSDICLRLKEAGLKTICPITFGQMEQKWTMNFKPLSKPNKKGLFNTKY
jgi:hypothetical protein